MRQHWTLDPGVVFLNHGSFGACPARVQAAQSAWRAEIEREPVLFLVRRLEAELDFARREVARFVGARAEDFVFVRNATSAVNAVLRSLEFRPGDALLVTDHAYGACRNALDFVARRASLRVDVVSIPLPIVSAGDVVDRIASAVTPATRLALVDHVTSQTGLIFPIAEIVRALAERGVETLVDGAHAPGMLELDLTSLGAAYYAGNLHKWVCAPRGAAMLVVREDRQRDLHPLAISHGYTAVRDRSRFWQEFDWTGSDDPSPWLSVPEAIRSVAELFPGGWAEARTHNRALALQARRALSTALGTGPLAPESMIGSLAAVALPDAHEPGPNTLQQRLFDAHRIEVPIFAWPAPPKRLLRISAAPYNTAHDYELLVAALAVELGA